jgi:membrane associated rhomboid family serine protease
VAQQELGVVCKSCGSEVSPYVTECPYCGARIRKRAPKLERHGDELTAKERRRRAAAARQRLRLGWITTDRPYATIAAILGSAVLVLVQRAIDRPLYDLGAIVGPVGSDWWRYLSSPFVYSDLGYLFILGVTVAVFGAALERRLGTVPALILILATGALGMVAADAVHSLIASPEDFLLAAGGNGIGLGVVAAWLAINYGEGRRFSEFDLDLIGVAVFGVVLLALPVVDDFANVWAGLAGGIVGGLAGLAADAVGARSG